MTIPKKGSRKIIVDDVVYRWRIRWKPSNLRMDYFNAYLNAAVELYDAPQGVLHIAFVWTSYKYYPTFEVEPVTPQHIESAIKSALELGWQPGRRGCFEVVHRKDRELEIFRRAYT